MNKHASPAKNTTRTPLYTREYTKEWSLFILKNHTLHVSPTAAASPFTCKVLSYLDYFGLKYNVQHNLYTIINITTI